MLRNRLVTLNMSRYAPYLLLLLRLVLAGIFIVSGVTKLPMQMEFAEIVRDFHILPDFLAVAYGAALPWVELMAGGYLLLGILIKPSAVIVLLMAVSFLIANISATVTGNYYCPNCFGELFRLTLPQAIAVDVLVMIASLMLLAVAGNREILGFDAWFRHRFGPKS